MSCSDTQFDLADYLGKLDRARRDALDLRNPDFRIDAYWRELPQKSHPELEKLFPNRRESVFNYFRHNHPIDACRHLPNAEQGYKNWKGVVWWVEEHDSNNFGRIPIQCFTFSDGHYIPLQFCQAPTEAVDKLLDNDLLGCGEVAEASPEFLADQFVLSKRCNGYQIVQFVLSKRCNDYPNVESNPIDNSLRALSITNTVNRREMIMRALGVRACRNPVRPKAAMHRRSISQNAAA